MGEGEGREEDGLGGTAQKGLTNQFQVNNLYLSAQLLNGEWQRQRP